MNPRLLGGDFLCLNTIQKKDCPKEQSFAYMGINITPEPCGAN